MANLTPLAIRKAKAKDTPYKLTDGKGLYLEVRPSGKKLWRYRYRIGGKENLFAAGEWCEPPAGEPMQTKAARIVGGLLTLEEARTKRAEWRGMVKQGIHPGHQRHAAKVANIAAGESTFKAVALDWIEANKSKDGKRGWSAYYLKQIENAFRDDVYPAIGKLPIRSVTSAHLLAVVKKVEKRGAATVARMIQAWCGAVFRYAIANLLADSDPSYAIRGAVKRPAVQHHAPLKLDAIPAFLESLGDYGGYRPTVIALRLLLLTFVRPGELRKAKWSEFDLEGAMWSVPPERMKMGSPHVVPLSRQAVALLNELHTLTGGQEWLFPNLRTPKSPMTMTTLNRALERMGYGGKFSAHGFRATASTALHSMGFKSEWIELQLAHADRNKSRASYNHAMYLEERTSMLQQWADVTEAKKPGKVVPMRQSA